jgi:hypothetical protein
MVIQYKLIIFSCLLIANTSSSPLLVAGNKGDPNSNPSPKAAANQLFESIPIVGPGVSNVIGTFTPILDVVPIIGTLLNSFLGRS